MPAPPHHVDGRAGHSGGHRPVLLLKIFSAHAVLHASHQQDGRPYLLQRPAKERSPLPRASGQRLGIERDDLLPVLALTPFVKTPRLRVRFGGFPLRRQFLRKAVVQRAPVKAVRNHGAYQLRTFQRRVQGRPCAAAGPRQTGFSAAEMPDKRDGLPAFVLPQVRGKRLHPVGPPVAQKIQADAPIPPAVERKNGQKQL